MNKLAPGHSGVQKLLTRMGRCLDSGVCDSASWQGSGVRKSPGKSSAHRSSSLCHRTHKVPGLDRDSAQRQRRDSRIFMWTLEPGGCPQSGCSVGCRSSSQTQECQEGQSGISAVWRIDPRASHTSPLQKRPSKGVEA